VVWFYEFVDEKLFVFGWEQKLLESSNTRMNPTICGHTQSILNVLFYRADGYHFIFEEYFIVEQTWGNGL
jgi:hypothetical protein